MADDFEGLTFINDFLRNYSSRDKLLRLWQYTAVLCDGIFSARWCLEASGVAKSIGSARLVFRLLNVPSTLYHVKNTLWWKQSNVERDRLNFAVDIVDCMANIAYTPIEHGVWAGQIGLFKLDYTKLSVWCTKLWIVLLIVSIMRTVQSLRHYKSNRKEPQNWKLLLDLIQNCSDLINAVNFLPSGFLWSSKLSSVIVGVMGIISSTIGLYKLL